MSQAEPAPLSEPMGEIEDIKALCQKVRAAGRTLAKAGSVQRRRAIEEAAALLLTAPHKERILSANALDVQALSAIGQTPQRSEAPFSGSAQRSEAPFIDRLRLDEGRLAKMAAALREVAELPDPVGEIEKSWRRPNGLRVAKQRIPLGVILIIYESRPNVTTDAGALCIKSGNAAILRGGSEAQHTNRALIEVISQGLSRAGLPQEAVTLCPPEARSEGERVSPEARSVPSTERRVMTTLLKQDEYIDLVIPRGGEGLIRFVAEHSRIPVVKHYRGNCHVFVEKTADVEMALAICYNAKVQRPGVCNAVETILIDRPLADRFLPLLADRLGQAGVELRGDASACAIINRGASHSATDNRGASHSATDNRGASHSATVGGMKPATEDDFYAEFLDLICAVAVVDGLDAAVTHIERYGSDHSEAIVTTDLRAAQRFTEQVNSACVLVNASTRFADGGELGLGAEIGISTTRLHAYGPMGAEQLTTTKFVILGDGQVRT